MQNIITTTVGLAATAVLIIIAVRLYLNIGEERYYKIMMIVRQAVLSAEQLGGTNEEKKREALYQIEHWLKLMNIRLKPARISEAIETAVIECFNYKRDN